MGFVAFKRGFEDGTTIKQLLFLHSVLGAVSFALFPALFSAGVTAIQTEWSLLAAVMLFAMSMVVNVGLFLFYFLFSEAPDMLWWAHMSPPYRALEVLAIGSPLVGMLCLLTFYSIGALVVAISAIGLVGLLSLRVIGSVREAMNARDERWRAALLSDDLELLDELDAYDFTKKDPDQRTWEYKITLLQTDGQLKKLGWLTLKHPVSKGDDVEWFGDDGGLYSVSRIIHSSSAAVLQCRPIEKDDLS
ncbi:hypothetical protein PRtIB026_A34950 [Pseudomonas sp. RtIB026]|nr:hypothetical protein PRtIB026_A34950 [Pseudomonas sp. RtIB026]